MHIANENLHNKKNVAAAVNKINICKTEFIQNRDLKTEVNTSEIQFCVQLENNRMQVWNVDEEIIKECSLID